MDMRVIFFKKNKNLGKSLNNKECVRVAEQVLVGYSHINTDIRHCLGYEIGDIKL